MEMVREASDRQFEGFVAEASDTLFRTGYLETAAALIDTGSYTCTSTAPATLPTGGALLHWPKWRVATGKRSCPGPGPALTMPTRGRSVASRTEWRAG
jgi:hypothetical protein